MSRHLPAISGAKLVRALVRAGFVVLRQRGSHVSLEKDTPDGNWRTVVPLHREIRPGKDAAPTALFVGWPSPAVWKEGV